MTLDQMLDGVDPDLTPSDQTMYEDPLWAFAWETLEEMNTAMATRVYARDAEGKPRFALIKFTTDTVKTAYGQSGGGSRAV